MNSNRLDLMPIFYNETYMNLIANWRNNSKIKKTLRSPFETDYDSQKEWAESVRKSSDQYFYIIESELNDKEDYDNNKKYKNLLVGYCGLDKLHIANRTAEISLLIGPKWQRQEYGKKVVRMLLEKAFNDYNLNLVFAETYFSLDFWKKCGFKEEGVLRDRKYTDGKYYDSYMLSITRDEFYENN